MNRVRIELVPAIGRSLISLSFSALFVGTHGLRRLTEDFVWGDHDRYECRSGHCDNCPQVHHHYHYNCQPRCYDCRR